MPYAAGELCLQHTHQETPTVTNAAEDAAADYTATAGMCKARAKSIASVPRACPLNKPRRLLRASVRRKERAAPRNESGRRPTGGPKCAAHEVVSGPEDGVARRPGQEGLSGDGGGKVQLRRVF